MVFGLPECLARHLVAGCIVEAFAATEHQRTCGKEGGVYFSCLVHFIVGFRKKR